MTGARGLAAPPIAGTLHPSTPGRAVAVRGYLALPDRVKGSRSAPAAPPLTRPTLARSGETGRPGGR